MSPKSRRVCQLALVSAALAALTAPAAHAQTSTINYKCKFPLIGTQPLALTVATDAPSEVQPGVPTDSWDVTGTFSFGGTFAQGFNLVEGLDKVTAVSGSHATALNEKLTLADGSEIRIKAPVDAEVWDAAANTGGAGPVEIDFTSQVPSLALEAPGPAALTLEDITLNFKGTYADGTPVEGLTTVRTDNDRVPYADIDGDPGTFNVPCKLDPTTQSALLAQLQVGEGSGPLTAPAAPAEGDYVSSDITTTTVNLRWRSATGAGLTEYVIRYPGGPAGGIHVPAPASNKRITGLTPDTAYAFSVSAVSAAGEESDALVQTFTTRAVEENQPPSRPGDPVLDGATPYSLTLSWSPASDDHGVAGYEVFQDGSIVATVTGTSATVSGLTPATAYDFRVVAFDAERQFTSSGTTSLRTTGGGTNPNPAGAISYRCKFPLVGTQPLTVKTTVGWPSAPLQPGVPTEPFAVHTVFTVGGTFAQGVALVEGLHKLGFVSDEQKPGKGTALRTRLALPDGAGLNVRVPLTVSSFIADGPIPSQLDEFVGNGRFPSLTVDTPGRIGASLERLDLNMQATYTDGTPIEGLTTPVTDVDRVPYADIDGDPGTFNVPCKLEPFQSTDLGGYDNGADTGEPITAPGLPGEGAYTDADISARSINVKWSPSTGARVKEYVIRYEGAPSGGIRVPKTATSEVITGLTPDSEYTVLVSAVDIAGNETSAVEQIFTTKTAPPNAAPSKPGAPQLISATPNSLTLSWQASTDDVGVAGYDVYQGSQKVATVSGATATVTNLTPNTSYTFRVEAFDGDGARTAGDPASARTGQALPGTSATLSYKCKFPLIGTQPLTLDIGLDLPDHWPVNTPTPGFSVGVKATVGGTTAQGLALVEGLRSIVGVSEAEAPGKGTSAKARVTTPSGFGIDVRVPINIDRYQVASPVADPVVLTASGVTPPLTFDDPGTAQVVLQEFTLNLKGLDADGNPIEGLRTPPSDIDRNPYTDIDGDPGTFNVPCKVDPAGQSLELASFELFASDPPPANVAPTKPTNLRAVPTATAATLTWNSSVDPDGTVAKYNVYRDSNPIPVATVTGTTATITGLTAGAQYSFTVEAVDNQGLRSPKSDPLPLRVLENPVDPTTPAPTTPPTGGTGTVSYGYALKGSTTLKTLTKGTLPLTGSIAADLKLATGAFTADLVLNETSGRLVAGGFLPVTAKVGFVPSGKTTGTLVDGVLKTNSKVRIKVKEVKLFGAIPLAGGNNCQTKNLSDISLKSTQAEFKPISGGPIAGTYKISDLNGCGGLNGLVSPLTAGGGNTINLNLAPIAR